MSTNNTRQTLWLGLGSFFSFMIGIVSPMILSRVFTKADYGTYKQVMYVYHTLLFVFTLGLPKSYSYFLPKYDRAFSRDINNKINYLFIGMGFVFSASLFLFSGVIADFLKNDDLSLALKYFSPTPLLLLPTIGLEGIYATYRKTQAIALYTVVTRLLMIALIVTPVFIFNGSYIHAIIGFDIASLLTCIVAMVMKNYPIRKETHRKSDLTYRQILKFSLPLMFSSLWGAIILASNQFFISRYYGAEVFADFSNGFMEIPFASMVLASVATVLLPRFSEMESGERMNDNVYSLWKSALEKSAKTIFPILIYSVVFARLIMICMYGNSYGTSSVYFMIKNISGLLYIVPFAPIMLAIGKTKVYANIHLIIAILIVISEYICVKTIDSPIAIAIISEICNALKIILMMRVVSHYARRSIFELIPYKPLFKILLLCLVAAIGACFITRYLEFSKWVLACISVLSFIFIYYLLCIGLKVSYREIIIGLMPQAKKSLLFKYLP